MTLYLTPTYHNTFFPFRAFNNDLCMLRALTDAAEPNKMTPRAVEPNYSYCANEGGAHVEIEMPGVAKENISIEVTGQKLIVKGKRFRREMTEKESDAGNAAKENLDDAAKETADDAAKENDQQNAPEEAAPILVYSLKLRLGRAVDVDSIKADHSGNGLLTVNIRMKAEKEPRQIPIGL